MKQVTIGLGALFLLLNIQAPGKAQFITTDWELHDVGQVIELVNNHGTLHQVPISDYPGLISGEFPPGSNVEHHFAVGPFYASLSREAEDTMVTTPVILQWNTGDELAGYSSATWDSVHKIERGDTMDIGSPENPYYPNYVPHSDQDLVTRYNDYNEASINVANHDPMFIDVYQRSWSWAAAPMNQFVIFNLDVIPTTNTLYDVWIGGFFNPAVGDRTEGGQAQDDIVTYHPEHRMIIAHDAERGPDGTTESVMGVKLIPPQEYDDDDFDWSFQWGNISFNRDKDRFEQISSGVVQNDQVSPQATQAYQSFGPIDSVAVGDTLSWRYATVFGFGEEEVLEKSSLIDELAPEFRVPSPPPAPDIQVTPTSRQVEITWDQSSETYSDPNRSDGVEQPFEGYRVYKSTETINGPWTLLASLDIDNNEYSLNTGLDHEFTDTGLMNNVEYHYVVTAFSKPDSILGFPSLESSKRANAVTVTPGTGAKKEVGKVAVVPNPYRGDKDYNASNPPWEKPDLTRDRWLEQDRRIQFINLPERSTIKIFTLSGRLVETLTHNNAEQGFEDWNLTSNVNQAVASGIYLFTVKNEETGNVQTGKFVIIK